MENRLITECEHHKFKLFFTLTYSDDNVPFFYVNRCLDGSISIESPDIFDEEGCPYVFYNTKDHSIEKKDLKFLENLADGKSFYNDNKLRVPSKLHITNFLKRVRSFINYYYGKRQLKKLRYFITSELGPEKLRPHYHGVFCFDSAQVAKGVSQNLDTLWKFGFVNVQPCNSQAASYVAKYVSCINYYPSIYGEKDFSQVTSYSRRPAIGTFEVQSEEVQKLYAGQALTVRITKNSKFKDVPLWRSCENYLFPRCKEFAKATGYDRVRRYQLFNRFEEKVSKGLNKFEALLQLSIEDGFCVPDFPLTDDLDVKLYRRYLKKKHVPLIGFYSMADVYISRRFFKNALALDIHPQKYLNIIENYYNSKDLDNLKQQYDFQSDFVDTCINSHRFNLLTNLHLLSLFYMEDLFKICSILGSKINIRDPVGENLPLKYFYFLDNLQFPFYEDGLFCHLKFLLEKYSHLPYFKTHRHSVLKRLKDDSKTKYLNDITNPYL